MPACRTVLLAFWLWCTPAAALVGGAALSDGADVGRHVVLIVGSRGTSCSGAAIASTLLLTAAHCVLPGAEYRLVVFDADHRPSLREVVSVTRHPGFDLRGLLGHRATADVALLKLAAPVPADTPPAALSAAPAATRPGDRFIVAGYGLAVPGDGKSGGIVRVATLAATGHPGALQLRLVDPATRGAEPGLGACTGDSGAPVFEAQERPAAIVGIVSWSTGPGDSAGCGGITGVTPLAAYRGWIVDTARRLGSPIEP